MTRIRFEEVVLIGTKRWTENGKRRQQTRRFMQTINPFNTNADGAIKTRDEIEAELTAERREWLDKP